MYRVGYIDDEPTEFEIYRRSLKRRCKELELVLIDDCKSKQDILDKIYEKQIDVLLIDYKMVRSYGFNGTTLINYINDSMRDIQDVRVKRVDKQRHNPPYSTLKISHNRFKAACFVYLGNSQAVCSLTITLISDFAHSVPCPFCKRRAS
ncbi:hypothetical protein FMM74_020410 [Lachnospiraceae bacterium MD308]|nr:hypothetical protein [Lachnospiraceae bacterium MD308]